MKQISDYRGRLIRLTEERLRHILDHPEMAKMQEAMTETLRDPAVVMRSRSDNQVELELSLLLQTPCGRQMTLCGGKI
ncbi:MAG TPA: hypothetical protein VGG19_07610 [Tepidisphaeraceae bacterium]|jgi:hypothetical protein